MAQSNHTNDPIEELRFDEDEVEARSKQMKDLRKHNIQGVFGTGKGRLSVIVIGVCLFAMAIYGFSAMFSHKAPTKADDRGAQAVLGALPPGDINVASDEEAAKRKSAIGEKATEAKKSGSPYVAPPVLRAIGDAETDERNAGRNKESLQERPESNDASANASASASGQTNVRNDASRSQQTDQRYQQQLTELRAMREKIYKEDIAPQINVAMGDSTKEMSGRMISTRYALPDREKAASAAAASAASAAATTAEVRGPKLISAGDGYYGTLTYSTNSDDGTNLAIAVIEQGPYTGSKVLGTPKFTDKNVTIEFDKLAIPGKSVVAIKAMAVDEVTYRTGVADDVDNHFVRRFGSTFLASIAKGFGEAAKMNTGTTTVISSPTTGVSTTVVPEISTSRQIQIAAGEVGTDMGEMIKQDNAQLKPTVTSNPKKGIGIVFLDDVYDKKI